MKEHFRYYFHDGTKMLFVLSMVMWVMIAISFFAILLTLFQNCFPCSISCTSDGIAYFISLFYPFRYLLSGTIMLMTIYVALASYVRSTKVEAIKALQDLRSMLMEGDNVKIHELLEFDEEDKKYKIDLFEKEFKERQGCVYNYMGILELAKFYIDEDIITIEQFKDQFGYRIENLYANPLIVKWINKYPCYWKTLNSLNHLMQNK